MWKLTFWTVVLILFLAATGPVSAADYYISPNGSNSNNGTSQSSPLKSFSSAWGKLQPGDTLYLLDGTYTNGTTGLIQPNVRDGRPNTQIDTQNYITYPLDHPERTKNFIHIKALNDGKAIIDGQGSGIPVMLGNYRQNGYGAYFYIEGIVAMNSSESVYHIHAKNVVLKRVSGYNANSNHNWQVFEVWTQCPDSEQPKGGITICSPQNPSNVLIEDAVGGGTGRKMFMAYNSFVNVIFRRVFAAWQSWRAGSCTEARGDCASQWPWGEGIDIYNDDAQYDISDTDRAKGYRNSIVENSIAYGRVSHRLFDLTPHYNKTYDNDFLGDIALRGGMDYNGNQINWPCPNPLQPWFQCTKFDFWQSQRSGFSFGSNGTPFFKDNLFQDLFAWGNAGVGFIVGPYQGGSTNNRLVRGAFVNNGLANNLPGCEQGQNISGCGSLNNLTSADTGKPRLRYRYVNGEYMDGTNGQAAKELWPWPMEDRIRSEFAKGYMLDNGVNGQYNPGQPVYLNNFSVTNLVVPLLNQYTAQQIPFNGVTPPPTPQPGDTDGNGVVNFTDYNNLISDFVSFNLRSDFNQNGKIDIFDHNILISEL